MSWECKAGQLIAASLVQSWLSSLGRKGSENRRALGELDASEAATAAFLQRPSWPPAAAEGHRVFQAWSTRRHGSSVAFGFFGERQREQGSNCNQRVFRAASCGLFQEEPENLNSPESPSFPLQTSRAPLRAQGSSWRCSGPWRTRRGRVRDFERPIRT